MGEEKRAGAYEFIRERLREGRQAYVVCPLVESGRTRASSAKPDARSSRPRPPPRRPSGCAPASSRDFEVGLLHGQMPARAQAGGDGGASPRGGPHVLVATSVIEVGIDVANATVMLVEGAERFGLSQLHQLRGRVGRGEHASQCILFADAGSELAHRRLEAIETERDGFKLAEVDLALRGEGEILGTRQHGLPRFRVAELPEDVGAPDRGAARGDRAASSGTARSRRPSWGRCSTRRAGASATSGPSRSRRERECGSSPGSSRDAAWRRRRGGPPPCGRPPTGCARRCSRSSGEVDGASVLDLFCGTGALGDRGALARGRPRHAGRHADRRWRGATSRELGSGAACEVVRSDALRYLRRSRRRLRPDLLRPAL